MEGALNKVLTLYMARRVICPCSINGATDEIIAFPVVAGVAVNINRALICRLFVVKYRVAVWNIVFSTTICRT